jgi:hypothetical protein
VSTHPYRDKKNYLNEGVMALPLAAKTRAAELRVVTQQLTVTAAESATLRTVIFATVLPTKANISSGDSS